MNNKTLPVFTLLGFFLLLIFSIPANAQIEPDNQIVNAMIAFANKSTDALDISRPRIFQKSENIENKLSESFEKEAGKNASMIFSLEHKAFDLLNEKRISNGLNPLKWSDDIAKIARYHSESMAQGNYFSHKEPDGSMVNNRADLFGMSNWKSIGENIAFNRGFKLPADSACEQWMLSPAHRDNILDRRWKESGIGVAIAEDGSVYFTQVFLLK